MGGEGEYEQILVERRNAVVLVTLNRPSAMNAWTWTMARELDTAFAGGRGRWSSSYRRDWERVSIFVRVPILPMGGNSFRPRRHLPNVKGTRQSGHVDWQESWIPLS